MTTARQENARTLAAAIGSSEAKVEHLLDATVLITSAPGGDRLAGYIEALLVRTLSNVRRELDGAPDVEVVVGRAAARSYAPVIGVGVDGYRIDVRDGTAALGTSARPIVQLVAACYAAAAAVHSTIGAELPVPLRLPLEIDLERLYGATIARLDDHIELGPCFMAGAGAIGNAVLAGFSTLNVHGELHICDPDDASDGNLNRCWWFDHEDIDKPKAERLVLCAQPSMPNLRLVPHVATLRDAIRDTGEKPVGTLIVGVDSRRARRSLQNEIPHRVFDASTSGITEFVLHFNKIPSDHACMSCIYCEAADEAAHEAHVAEALGVGVADVRENFVSESAAQAIARTYPRLDPAALKGLAYDSLFKELCGKGQLKTSTADRVLAPFGFVSVLAGVMLAIEIAIRTGTLPVPDYNYWRISPWGAPIDRMREQRSRHPACEFCGNETLQSVVKKLWG